MDRIQLDADERRRRRQEKILMRDKDRLDLISGVKDKIDPIEQEEREEWERKIKEKQTAKNGSQSELEQPEIPVYPTSRLLIVLFTNAVTFFLVAFFWTHKISFPILLTTTFATETFSLFMFAYFVQPPFVGRDTSHVHANFGFRMLVTMLLFLFRAPQEHITYALNTIVNLCCILLDLSTGLSVAYVMMFLVNL